MATDKSYELYGGLPDPWIVTLRIDKQGIAKAKVRDKREAPADLTELAGWAKLNNAPRPGGLGLPCTGISLEWQRDGGMWQCEWDYDGAADPQDITFAAPENTTYEIDCALTTAPVETHPRFLAIAKQYGVTSKNYDKSGGFLNFPKTMPVSTSVGDGTVQNPLYGTTDYYISTLTWRVNSATLNLPTDFRKNLGLIDTPRNQGGPALPAVDGKQNWLKSMARATWRGNIWATQEEWILSGINGWNPDLYRPQG